MTNFVHALAVLEAARRPGEIRIHPHDAVEALAKAGLIAPERMIPHPNPPIDVHKPAWEVTEFPDKWVSVLAKKIWITDSHGWGKSITTDQARNLALALLAAAQYAEEA